MNETGSARRIASASEPAHPAHAANPGGRSTVKLLDAATRPARRARALRTALLLLLLALFATIAYFALSQLMQPAAPRHTLAVRRRPIASALHEIGTVAAHIERPVLTRFAGEITWREEDGALVEAGDPVVRFDSKLLEDDIELREKDLSDKIDAVARAEKGIRVTQQKYESLIRQKEIDLRKAELDRKITYGYPRPDELLDVELTWKSAVKDMDMTQIQTDGLLQLGKQGFASDAVIKKKQLELANAKSEAARSKLILDLTRQGKTPELKRVDDLAVADAKKALNVAIFNREADLGATQSALDLARTELAGFQYDLHRKKMRLQSATVRAPIRGRVIFQAIYKGSEKNRSPIQAGETRMEGSDLCTLLDTSHLIISLWINEMDIGNVRMGQKADVLLPAMPGRTFQAEVSEIAVTAQDKNIALSPLALRRSGEAFVNVVKVKLSFVNLTEEIKNRIRVGFTADVRLFAGDGAPALSVPWQAVGRLNDGTPFADAIISGKIERRVLKLGRSDNAAVEILEGLSDNMSVLDASNSSIPMRDEIGRDEIGRDQKSGQVDSLKKEEPR